MSPLESRKQLLISESELNREHLVGDMAALAAGVHSLADRAKSFGAMVSLAALFAAGLTALKHGRTVDSPVKPSWWRTMQKGAGLISTVWMALRSRRPGWQFDPPEEGAVNQMADRVHRHVPPQ